MEVILLKKVGGLGALGEKVAVRPGFGRNYLVPQGFAVPATAKNLEAFEQRRAELEQAAAAAMADAEARKARLDGLTVSIARKAGDQGRLFGSVGTGDIAAAITAAGIDIDKAEVRLPQGPMRAVGEFDIEIHLHTDVDTTVRVDIVPLN